MNCGLRLVWRLGAVILGMGSWAPAWAYSLESQRWASSPIVLQLQLDTLPLGRTLADGSSSWGQVAEAALSEWNGAMADVQFTAVRNSSAGLGAPNGINNVFFGTTVYGDSWGSGVLAVTLTYTSGLRRVESDVVFKASVSWDSYRGGLRSATDFKRVALHELGHVIGLNHPDEAGQSVIALMNSTISNLDALAADDLAGAQAGYGTPVGARLPVITSMTGNQSILLGSNAVFAVAASGTAPLSYQWRKNAMVLPGATAATLTLSAVQLPDAGSYSVVVTNAAGSVIGGPSLLTVTVPPPTVVSQPVSRTVVAGSTTSFSVVASGVGVLSYQWSKNGSPVPGATLPALTLENVQLAQAGDYLATISNAGGSVISNVATLTVQPPPRLPVIATPPVGQSVAVGSTFSLSVVASGAGALSYLWRKEGLPIPGATSSVLTVANVQTTDAGSYTVTVSNAAGAVTSEPVTVAVSASLTAPSILTAPLSVTVPLGAPASFTVVAQGTAPLGFAWRRDGVLIPGATSAILSIVSAQESDVGSYTVTVTNGAGSVTSAGATLTVDAPLTLPRITAMPVGQTVLQDSAVTFSVTATGTRPLTYQWFKDGSPLPGATEDTLNLGAVKPGDAGSFTVRVSNAAGSVVSDPALLVVQVPATVPVIITPPSPATSSVGAPASFSVVADGAAPLTYSWRRDGVLVPGATRSTLVIGGVQEADRGEYAVTVTNALGSVTSPPVRLTVLVPSLPPVVLVQPVNVTATAGANASFGVTVRGTAPLAYQWRKEGVPIEGATQATLTLGKVTSADAATYAVEITNAFGSVVSANARLTVLVPPAPPRIESPPMGRTATEGEIVSLAVMASGASPLTYQWSKGGVLIPGATGATLTFNPVRLTDGGSYAVAVTNAVGTAASGSAWLTVVPRPVGRISNVSIRAPLVMGQTLIVGLSMAGGARPVLVRGVGPGLASFGVTDAMMDPRIAFYRDSALEGGNDDWGGGVELTSLFASVGAFALPATSRDAAALVAIEGGRTVQVTGTAAGTVLVEAYDVGPGHAPRLVNVSARNRVVGSRAPLIAGFTLAGNAPRTILIRAIGPTLAAFGVADALADPRLEVYDGPRKIDENNDWPASLASTFAATGAFALAPGSRDAALVVTLGPGGYTVQVSGVGEVSGEALIELYEVVSP